MHLVIRVIYQESKPTAKLREEKAPDLHSPAERNVTAPHIWASHCSLTASLPPRHLAGPLGSRASLFGPWRWENSIDPQKGFGVHGNCLEHRLGQTPIMWLPVLMGHLRHPKETLGTTGTEEIIYHLYLTGLQGRGRHPPSLPWFKEHPVQILFCTGHLLPFSTALWIQVLGHWHAPWEDTPAIPASPSSPLKWHQTEPRSIPI